MKTDPAALLILSCWLLIVEPFGHLMFLVVSLICRRRQDIATEIELFQLECLCCWKWWWRTNRYDRREVILNAISPPLEEAHLIFGSPPPHNQNWFQRPTPLSPKRDLFLLALHVHSPSTPIQRVCCSVTTASAVCDASSDVGTTHHSGSHATDDALSYASCLRAVQEGLLACPLTAACTTVSPLPGRGAS